MYEGTEWFICLCQHEDERMHTRKAALVSAPIFLSFLMRGNPWSNYRSKLRGGVLYFFFCCNLRRHVHPQRQNELCASTAKNQKVVVGLVGLGLLRTRWFPVVLYLGHEDKTGCLTGAADPRCMGAVAHVCSKEEK